MPAEAPTSAPAAAAAATPTAPSSGSGGIAGLMADLDSSVSHEAPPAGGEPAAGGGEPAAPKPAAPKPAAKPATAVDPLKQADPAEDPEKIIKTNQKAWKVFESFKKSSAAREAALQAQIDAIKNKPVEGVADAGKIKALEERIAQLSEGEKTWKQKAAEADFTRSEEYTNRFVLPYNWELKTAIDEVKSLTFKVDDETTRPATEQDFRKALALPIDEQDAFIHEKFGRSAYRVISRINEIGRIRSAAAQAVSEHAENFDKANAEKEALSSREKAEYDQHFEASTKEIQSHPIGSKYFAESDTDPEGSKLLREGYEKFDSLREAMAKMKPDERAAVAAVTRARFAALPRVAAALTKAEAELKSLREELSKFRRADPGSAKPAAGAPAGTPEESKTISGMAASFDNL